MPQLIREGKLVAEFRRNSALRRPEDVGEPRGTRSQLIRYYNQEGEWLLDVFQYLWPDGSIGASGRPDPKAMRVGDEIWVADPEMEV